MGFVERAIQAFVPDKNKKVTERKHLTTLSLAALVFFAVSGGPYGTEDAIGGVGVKYVLIGYMVLPVIWCIPEALITAEYSTAFPEATGSTAWVGAAFGSFWAWMSAWFAFISAMINASSYPVLMLDYLQLQWPQLSSGWARIFTLLLIAVALVAANWLGLEVVGIAQVINAVFVMSPFFVIFFYALPDWDASKWGQVESNPDWSTWINVMFWNLNYWSYAANVGAEIEDHGKTLPRAMMIAVVLVALGYLVPLATVTAVMPKGTVWKMGFLAEAGRLVAGRGVMVWVMVAAVAGSVGLALSALTTSSYLLHGLGQRGFVPKIFAHRGRFDTPTWAIWIQVIPVCCLVNLNLGDILLLINTTFAATLLVGFAAGIYLRVKMPDLPRPYQIPLNTVCFTVVLIPPSALLVWILTIPFYQAKVSIIVSLVAILILGLLAYPLVRCQGLRRVIPFLEWDLDWTCPPQAHPLPTVAKDTEANPHCRATSPGHAANPGSCPGSPTTVAVVHANATLNAQLCDAADTDRSGDV